MEDVQQARQVQLYTDTYIIKVFPVYNSNALIGRVLHNKLVWTVVMNHRRQKKYIYSIYMGLAMMHSVESKETATTGE